VSQVTGSAAHQPDHNLVSPDWQSLPYQICHSCLPVNAQPNQPQFPYLINTNVNQIVSMTFIVNTQTQCFFATVQAGAAYRKIWRLDNNFFARIIRLTVQKFQLFWVIFCLIIFSLNFGAFYKLVNEQIECLILFCFILQVNWSDRGKCYCYPFSIFLLKFQ